MASLPCGQFCRDLFDSDLHLTALADLLAFHLLPPEETDIKQLLLEELDVVARAEMLLREMQTLGRKIETGHQVCSDWPPAGYAN